MTRSPRLPRGVLLALLLAPTVTAAQPAPAAPVAQPPAPVRRGDAVEIVTPGAHVLVSFPVPGVVRLRLSRAGEPALPSFAVEPTAGLPFQVEESAAAVTVRSAALAVRVTRDPLRIALLDAGGTVIAEEAAPVEWPKAGFAVSWSLAPDEKIYGLGDRHFGLEHRGIKLEMWNADAFGAYHAFPFMLFLGAEGRAHGLLVDSPARALVDLAATQPDRVVYRARSGAVADLYLLAGPTPRDVLGQQAALTGRMPLPPRWALGYHQCRYSYMSEDEVREVASRLRQDRIPADAVWLDIDYQQDYRPFTVDRSRFPDLGRMAGELRAHGLRTVAIVDPHVAQLPGAGYAPYDTGLAGDHFVHAAPGGPVFSGDVWPSRADAPAPSVFPDFANAGTRAWWGGLFRAFVDQGIGGFWNDMDEPAIFSGPMPATAVQRLDGGATAEHRDVHNAYGLTTARATYEGVRTLRPAERPFVLTRAAYAGAQRWAATWTGDGHSSWGDLQSTVPMLLGLGVSGMPFVGADVGGFFDCPDPELLTTWTEVAAFQPFFRNHSDRSACRREPWLNGAAHEARRRAAIERRYRLLPYLYTAFEEASRTGLPVMRPLWLEYPADPSTWKNERAFLLGRDLLIAARLEERAAPYAVALPAADWWDTRSGERVAGGGPIALAAGDDRLRVLARAGAIVPSQPVVQHTGERADGPLTVDVWPGPDCAGAQYLDDGASFAFERGELRRVAYACRVAPAAVTVTSTSTGSYRTWWRSTEVVLHGVPSPPRRVAVKPGPRRPAWRYDAALHAATVTVPGSGSVWSVTVGW